MSKTKSAQTYALLKTNQAQLYRRFQQIHQAFSQEPEKNRIEFNRLGRDFLNIVRSYERRLCAGMEKSIHASYSTNVSEKYWRLIREEFPLIDQIGISAN